MLPTAKKCSFVTYSTSEKEEFWQQQLQTCHTSSVWSKLQKNTTVNYSIAITTDPSTPICCQYIYHLWPFYFYFLSSAWKTQTIQPSLISVRYNASIWLHFLAERINKQTRERIYLKYSVQTHRYCCNIWTKAATFVRAANIFVGRHVPPEVWQVCFKSN